MTIAKLLLIGASLTCPAAVRAQPFPDTGTLLPRVVQHQKEIESLLNQYTFTQKVTVFTLDKTGGVREQHTDTYYVTPTPQGVFTLQINHDGQPVSKNELAKQERDIEKKIRENDRKTQKGNRAHPPEQVLLFADTILASRFTPLRWETWNAIPAVVYAFEPKAPSPRQASLEERIAGDMKGRMWISPSDAEILRMEFASASPLSFGFGLLGNVKSFEGFIQQRKVHDEVWLPSYTSAHN
jgi:hypothetical protein